MKYYVEVEDRTFEFDFQEEDQLLHAQVGDQRLTLDLRQITEPSLYSLLIDNRSYELFAEVHGDEIDLLLDGEMFHLKVQDEWTRRLATIQRKDDVNSGDLAIKAPMPGAVVSVEVTVGQSVKRGEGLIILAAMKMENELKAPRAGQIKSIDVQPGQTVEQGRTLVVLE